MNSFLSCSRSFTTAVYDCLDREQLFSFLSGLFPSDLFVNVRSTDDLLFSFQKLIKVTGRFAILFSLTLPHSHRI